MLFILSLSIAYKNSEEHCSEKVLDGKYDMTLHPTTYPNSNTNLTQGILIQEVVHVILTLLRRDKGNIEQVRPNYSIFSSDVYAVWIALIFILAISSIFRDTMSKRTSPSFKLRRGTTILFDLVTAHLKNMNYKPRNKVLHLTLLLSVTLLIAVYCARFSNQSMSLKVFKAYSSYKSLRDDPPDVIVAQRNDIKLIDKGGLNRPGHENYLAQIRHKIETAAEAGKDLTSKRSIVYLSSYGSRGCGLFEAWLKLNKVDGSHIMVNRDPDAVRTYIQLPFSNTVKKTSVGQEILKTIRQSNEMDLLSGYQKYYSSLTLGITNSNPLKKQLQEMAFSECRSEKLNSILGGGKLKLFKEVLYFFLKLLYFPCLVLVIEAILHSVKKHLAKKKNLVRPLAKGEWVRIKTVNTPEIHTVQRFSRHAWQLEYERRLPGV